MSEVSQSPEQVPNQPPTRKRGRKRIDEPLVDMSADEQLDAEKKRKLQNRAAQRAFRERKEKHVTELEERVKLQEEQLREFVLAIRSLAAENEALRRGEDPPVTDVPSSALNYDLSSNPAVGMTSTPSSGLAASPTEVKPRAQPRRSKKTAATPPEPVKAENAQLPIPVLPPPPPPPLERPASSLDLLARASQAPDSTLPLPPELSVPLPTNFDEATFDFDAPFDFSETMPLPPLFSSLAEEFELMGTLGGGGGGGVSGATLPASTNPAAGMNAPGLDGEVDDVCPNEEDEPPLLPGNRIPCDKPECDFTAVSCALPVPWRPPTVAGDDKNLWVAQKCWAKLCSHPLFPLCDSDELCQLLRDKTRCSDDGRLVCHKSGVCDIFRSLPKRAKIRQQTLSMA
ncbi:hypothetical protein JCM8115_006090 [Rhodotorula mucilaginosa]|uniref:BZIP domain-containing protein n=1 Tax=Rhodotorula mucilaginosa TaxID=5537 RepID=A0A9P6W658_RHOMI|nr:hypothetical protein C6P46_006432 [Rhodotorula mucilaginosa]